MYSKLKTRFATEVFKGDKSTTSALEKAYADMSRRATGHKEQMKIDCLTWFLENEVFQSALSSPLVRFAPVILDGSLTKGDRNEASVFIIKIL